MKLLNSFKKLPLGYYRLLIASWVLLPLLSAIIAASISRDDDAFFGMLIIGIVIYYLIARLVVWVYEGFKNDKI